MPLTYITDLRLSGNNQCLNMCTKLLGHMPNIHALVLDTMPPSKMYFLSKKPVKTVDLIYDNNVINVAITYALTLDTVELLINLFPRMQCLCICKTKKNHISTVRILLLKRINTNHLFSLTVNDEYVTIEQLKIMIDCEKLLDDYKIEHMKNGLCLWW